MKDALRLYTWRGIYVDRIDADALRSHSAATEYGPFGDDQHKPVYWVRWGTRENGSKIPPYFRHWPKGGAGGRMFPTLAETCADRIASQGESSAHKKAKTVAVSLLNRLVREKKGLSWSFVHPEVSDFPLSGDLLSEVTQAVTEYSVATPFGENYRFDVALIHSSSALSKPQVLAAIEFELTHTLPIWKVAISKAMGFPIVTIDLEGLSENEITEDWLLEILTETTKTNTEGRRRNFFFVHSMLYPVFVDVPPAFRGKHLRHQYVVFAADQDLDKLKRWLAKLHNALGIDKKCVLIQPNPNKNEFTKKTMEHEGSMAGHDWASYNGHCYHRISIDCPLTKQGPLYLFHLIMARLLTSEIECLVGYKYRSSAQNDHPEEPCWTWRVHPEPGTFVDRKLILKHLSQPLKPLKAYLDLIETDRKAN